MARRKKTLLQIAQESPRTHSRILPDFEDISIAWIKDELSLKQVKAAYNATGRTPSNVGTYVMLLLNLREAIRKRRITIK